MYILQNEEAVALRCSQIHRKTPVSESLIIKFQLGDIQVH